MRTLLFTVALLIFTASASYAAGPAPKAVECKPTTAQVDGHEVTTKCLPDHRYIYQEWDDKDGNLDRADGPAIIVRYVETGTVTFEQWRKNGKLDRPDGPTVIWRDPATGTVTDEEWWKDGERIAPPRAAAKDKMALTKTGTVTYDVERDPATGTVTVYKSYSNGQQITPPRAAAR